MDTKHTKPCRSSCPRTGTAMVKGTKAGGFLHQPSACSQMWLTGSVSTAEHTWYRASSPFPRWLTASSNRHQVCRKANRLADPCFKSSKLYTMLSHQLSYNQFSSFLCSDLTSKDGLKADICNSQGSIA